MEMTIKRRTPQKSKPYSSSKSYVAKYMNKVNKASVQMDKKKEVKIRGYSADMVWFDDDDGMLL
tara:strand:- start:2931 stop:3122 length:192 start_codon:yes stop_codon:yes gene_type:complete